MMQFAMAILLTGLQFCVGFGLLHRLRICIEPLLCIAISVLVGIAIFSALPFLLQLLFVPLTPFIVFTAIALITFLLNLPSFRQYRRFFRKSKGICLRIRFYEIPAVAMIVLIVFASVWRCYYYPPTPRDLTSGAEVIADYAVREKTMVNSVFTVNLETTNNQFKPPFITSLQIIYKMAGFPFGQVWLSTIFIALLLFLHTVLRQHLHALFAGLLLLFFICIPEMYAYTVMVLFDYSNAVFFTLAIYFLTEFFKTQQRRYFFFSATLMSMATYIRSETLVLATLATPAVMVHFIGRKDTAAKAFGWPVLYLLPSLVVYLASVTLYIGYYLPAGYEVANLVNRDLFNLSAFFHRFGELNAGLLFSETSIEYYGYFTYLFLLIFLLDAILYRRWSRASRNFLYAVLLVYAGIGLTGHLLPLMDIYNSSKRALFKIFPLMLLYMANSPLLVSLSASIAEWEKKNSKGKQLVSNTTIDNV
jgi:hypothetical protein